MMKKSVTMAEKANIFAITRSVKIAKNVHAQTAQKVAIATAIPVFVMNLALIAIHAADKSRKKRIFHE